MNNGNFANIEVVQYVETKAFVIKEIRITEHFENGEILVQPLVAGICGSDILYFKGEKEKEKLAERLPLVLLHEGVVRDTNTGNPCVIIPLRVCGVCCSCKDGHENLCQNAEFLGSNIHGLARTYMTYPKELLIPLEKEIPLEVGVLFEPMSIILRMLKTIINIYEHEKFLIIGTGTMGLLSVIFLHYLFNVPSKNIFILGRNDKKLEILQNICQPINIYSDKKFIKNHTNMFPLVIEAVGGKSMVHSLQMAIELCKPGAEIYIYGLNNQTSNVNFTKIVNKGLVLRGTSRSYIKDYENLMSIIKEHKAICMAAKKIIHPEVFFIQNSNDLMNAFHAAISGNTIGKILVSFVKGIL